MRTPQLRHNFGAKQDLTLFVLSMSWLGCLSDAVAPDAASSVIEPARKDGDSAAASLDAGPGELQDDATVVPIQHDTGAASQHDAGVMHADTSLDASASAAPSPPADASADASPADAGLRDASLADGTAPSVQVGTCSGKRGAAGEAQRELGVSGKKRLFIQYVPRALDPTRPAPVVLVFHGANMSAAWMRDLTGFEALADAHGFIAVFAEGDSQTWNVRPQDSQVCGIGELYTNPSSDDVRFVEDMLADLESNLCIDRGHVFATGFSMGGYFTNHLACQRPELLRAAAPHSSGTYRGACKGKVPMLILHGTGDLGVDLACGLESRTLWTQRNGCGAGVVEQPIKRGHCEKQQACPGQAPVTLCLLDDMCHAWAGRGTGELLCLADFGSGPGYEDASALIWRFFKENW